MYWLILIKSTFSCDFQPPTVISDDLISYDFVELSQEKNIVEEVWSIMGALVSLYSTEITRCRSWFLEYKLIRVNSVPHRRSW